MRKPPIEIHYRINTDTCGGRRAFKKEAEGGATYKAANPFNSCGGLNPTGNIVLGYLLANKYRHLVSQPLVLPASIHCLHGWESHFSKTKIDLGSLSLVLFLFPFPLDWFSLLADLAHGLHPQHCHDLLGSVSTVDWQ